MIRFISETDCGYQIGFRWLHAGGVSHRFTVHLQFSPEGDTSDACSQAIKLDLCVALRAVE